MEATLFARCLCVCECYSAPHHRVLSIQVFPESIKEIQAPRRLSNLTKVTQLISEEINFF